MNGAHAYSFGIHVETISVNCHAVDVLQSM